MEYRSFALQIVPAKQFYAIDFAACLCGTELGMLLPLCYEQSGTEIAYAATRRKASAASSITR
eukprot:3603469-Rhodomonas_salina.1